MDKNHSKDEIAINTVRILSADMVQKANSGHPGLPLGAAPMAFRLFSEHMKHNGKNPAWADRDRFVLSAGHGSALLYALLHLFGYDISMDDLQKFRQLGSKTSGHPEYPDTPGVDVTTGPLGQGVANAVGMALAETFLAARFNRPGYEIADHYTYVLCGDGCLMQGISNEAASLAGTLKLGKLVLLYDSNDISIEGSTSLAFSENVGKRFEALGWDVHRVEDGNDLEAIDEALRASKLAADKPSFIEVKTVIGYGSPNKAGKASAHGEPLGAEELALTKEFYGFNPGENFIVPPDVSELMCRIKTENEEKEARWNELFRKYKEAYPELCSEWDLWHSGEIPDFTEDEKFWEIGGDSETRTSSHRILNYISGHVQNIIGGSADLGPSNKSVMNSREYYSAENRGGSNIHFGVREFSMTAIANGMLAHGGLRPYVAEFFVFSDYMKAAFRMAALMRIPLIILLTHDSIGVGEDGPTHQPVEQLSALRSIPNMTVVRPADGTETAAAWQLALSRRTSPTAIVLTRQKVRQIPETSKEALKGGYILKEFKCLGKALPDIILLATGSEVSITLEAAEMLAERGFAVRVVSMPSWRVFDEQPAGYREAVLPDAVRKRLAVEAGSSFGWYKYVGLDGATVTIDSFGQSGPASMIFEKYGFTADNVLKEAVALLDNRA